MSAPEQGVWARLGGRLRAVPAVDVVDERPAAVPGLERALALGLTAGEYELIVARLGREPGEVELAMFSLLWSEHCAYKHSKLLLRTLPTEGGRLVLGPGENAGAVVERALPALGFEGVHDVRIGRLIELEVADPSRLPEMCERLLANPLIEDYEVLLDPL